MNVPAVQSSRKPSRMRDASPDGQPHYWTFKPFTRYVKRGVCDCGAVKFFADEVSKFAIEQAEIYNKKHGKKGAGHEITLRGPAVKKEEENMVTETEKKLVKEDYTLYTAEEKKLIAQEAEKIGRKETSKKYNVPRKVLWGWVNVYCRGLSLKAKPPKPAAATLKESAAKLGARLHEEAPPEPEPPPLPPEVPGEYIEKGFPRRETKKGSRGPREEKAKEKLKNIKTTITIKVDDAEAHKKIGKIAERLKGLKMPPGFPRFRWWWFPSVQRKWLEVYERLMTGGKS